MGANSKVIYRRRRLAALVVLIIFLVIIFWIIGALANKNSDNNRKNIVASPTQSSLPNVVSNLCDQKDVEVSVEVDKSNYEDLERPKLVMGITNNSSGECVINVGTSQIAFTISSASEKYWSSTDCQIDPVDNFVVFKAGQKRTTLAINWDLTRSALDTCDIVRDNVPRDKSYELSGRLGAIESKNNAGFFLK